MYTVMTIVGTRPEIIKLARVIPELDASTKHILVHTGQNYDYELNQIFFDQMGIRKPDYFLEAVKETTAGTIGAIIEKSDFLMAKIVPDAVLVYGDTNSCLSVISAKRRKIPIFHMEAGNRCFDDRVPEEINRRIVDHTSDINMTLTEHARRYLLSEGLRPEKVFNIGSSMHEVLNHYKKEINNSEILKNLNLDSKKYFVLSAHREENVDSAENFTDFVETINYLGKHYRLPLIFSTHPRTMKKIKDQKVEFNEFVRIIKPLGFFDYIHLQKEAYCVISDSGTITEESSLLGFPAVTIRNAHERPEGFDAGTLIMAGLKKDDVQDAIDTVVRQAVSAIPHTIVCDYNVPNVSHKVVKIIMSYIRYIRSNTWKIN
jgi:UDP-N-acetylglucosamine 2-epimerase (non-hydrolysing)